jgi:hypothetical protein
MTAARNPINLDDLQVNAVAARIEVDLRIGAAFTRFQTLLLQPLGGGLEEKVISYGMKAEENSNGARALTAHRILSIPYPWIRSRSLLPC